MVSRVGVIIGLVAFWVFMPVFLMLMNVSGFTQANMDITTTINAEDFNLFSLTGFSTFFNYLFDLARFTIGGMGVFVNFVLLFFGIVSFVIIVLLIRGGGS